MTPEELQELISGFPAHISPSMWFVRRTAWMVLVFIGSVYFVCVFG